MIFQKENFIPNLDYILPSLHKQKLYDKDEFTKKFESSSWPGFRSQVLTETEPFFVNHLSSLLSNLQIFKNINFNFSICPECGLLLISTLIAVSDLINS